MHPRLGSFNQYILSSHLLVKLHIEIPKGGNSDGQPLAQHDLLKCRAVRRKIARTKLFRLPNLS